MTQQRKARLAMAAFLTACLIPSIGMFLLPAPVPAANQVFSPPPRIWRDGRFNPNILRETADYVADHLGFRQELITAHAALNAAAFHVSTEDAVVMGKGNWLFYRETLPAFLHTAPLSERQLYGAAHTLSLLREYAAGQGAELYLTIAPDKASLYPEYLPAVGEPLAGADETDRLVPVLESEGVPYIDLFRPFQEQEEILYYHTDSHWNVPGAALAGDILTAAMKPDWTQAEAFFPGPRHEGESHRGDLYEMLFPAGTYQEPDTAFDRPFSYAYTRTYRGPMDQRIETESPGKSGSLLMFRDSFGSALHPFLAEAFGTARFSRAMPVQMSLLDGADTVLIEIVERNLEYLARHAPAFPAPVREGMDAPETGTASASVRAEDAADELPGFVRLSGTLYGTIDRDSPVYVRLNGVLYEASPAGEEWDNGIPFTLYVEPSAVGREAEIWYTGGGTRYACRTAVMET